MTEMLIDQSQIEGTPWNAQVVVESDAPPVGVVIVGMAQAGKSKARVLVERAWAGFENVRPAFSFPLSNGYRGITAAVIEWAGLDPSETPEKDKYHDFLQRYLDIYKNEALAEQLDGFYQNPCGDDVWRTRAVSDVVSFTSGLPEVRPHVNAAASRHLRSIIASPERAKLHQPPGLVVLDGRNGPECVAKFAGAGVKSLGMVVLTCDETIAAGRSLLKQGREVTAEALDTEARKLKQRNADDRAREVKGGRMTLPQDLSPAYFADEAAQAGDIATLYDIGQKLPFEPEAGMAIATDTLPLAQEEFALAVTLRGMLSVTHAHAMR